MNLIDCMKRMKVESARNTCLANKIMCGPRALSAITGETVESVEAIFSDCLDKDSGMYVIDLTKTG